MRLMPQGIRVSSGSRIVQFTHAPVASIIIKIKMQLEPKIDTPSVTTHPYLKENSVKSINSRRVSFIDGLVKKLAYHSYTIFLFICSDFKTTIIPSTIFGVSNSFATTAYGLGDSPPISFELVAARLLRTSIWVTLVLLPICINNQRSPSSIAEDGFNKSWRPMPQKRITPKAATDIMCVFLALVQAHGLISHGIGHRQSALLFALDLCYNNFGGSDSNPVIRNVLNGFAYLCFLSGALEVALGEKLSFPLQSLLDNSDTGYYLPQWLFIITCVIITTMHVQDLGDQKGDALRGRRSMPLVFGDGPARWTVAIPMTIWGVVCPYFWDVRPELFALSLGLSGAVALRALFLRGVEDDHTTFRVWNCWIASIYVLPIFSRLH